MYKTDFIISYDISCEKRLRKIAKILEKNTMRIQRSVYLCKDVTQNELFEILEKVIKLINNNEDDLRIYKIKKGSISLQSGIDLENPTVFKE